jgi:hypothetical protein
LLTPPISSALRRSPGKFDQALHFPDHAPDKPLQQKPNSPLLAAKEK